LAASKAAATWCSSISGGTARNSHDPSLTMLGAVQPSSSRQIGAPVAAS
jgi:hypothetical protein